MAFLSNDWWSWFLSNYSMTLAAIPTVIAFSLKLVAIFHPKVPSDKILDLIQSYWPVPKGPLTPTGEIAQLGQANKAGFNR